MSPIEVAKLTKEIINMCDDRETKIMCQFCPHHRLCEYLDKELTNNRKYAIIKKR